MKCTTILKGSNAFFKLEKEMYYLTMTSRNQLEKITSHTQFYATDTTIVYKLWSYDDE